MAEEIRIGGKPVRRGRRVVVPLDASLSKPERALVDVWNGENPEEVLIVVEAGLGAEASSLDDALSTLATPPWGTFVFEVPEGKSDDYVLYRLTRIEALLVELSKRRDEEKKLTVEERKRQVEAKRQERKDLEKIDVALRSWKPSTQ